MVLDPGAWLRNFMDLTLIPPGFKLFILALALGGFFVGWVAEKHIFLWAARLFGMVHDKIWSRRRKVRKQYKTLLEDMRI
jgi:cation-transporting P-type ATPase 13A2